MTYPCKGCGAVARYELLPLNEDSLRMPTYWCRACWDRAFGLKRTRDEATRLLRDRGAVRDLEPGGDGPEAQAR